jgi:outer membrane protein assembly factor BamB
VVALVAVLVVAAVIVVVNRYVMGQEWWQSEHGTTQVPPGALTTTGPPPGPLTATWRTSSEIRSTGMAQFDQISHGIVANQLVTTTARGFDVRDARTGGPRWYYHRTGWSLLGWSATGRDIIGYYERLSDRSTHVMIGFDVASGRELWRSTTVTPPVVDQAQPRWPAYRGAVLVARGRRQWLGLDPHSGRTRWSERVPGGCAVPGVGSNAVAGDGDLGLLVAECRVHGRLRGRVLAVDPENGKTRWQKDFGDPADLSVDTRAGISEVWDGETLHLFDATGKELLTRSGDQVCRDTTCPYAVVDGTAVVAIGGDHWTLIGVNTDTGDVRWQRRTGHVDQMTSDDSRVYALRTRMTDALLPAAAETIDPATGKGDVVPLPFTYRQSDSTPWLGTGGGMLYAAYPVPTLGARGGIRLTALRAAPSGPGPDTLGGVRASVWPDACALLTRADVEKTFPGDTYTRRATRVEVGGVSPKAPASCTYVPASQGAARPGVTVRWVTQTPREARALLASLRAGYADAKALPDVGDQAYDLGSLSGEVVVRVGRFILGVSVGRESGGTATRLARQAADRLRAESTRTARATKPTVTATPG